MDKQDFISLSQDLSNWIAMSELPSRYPQFSYSTLKTLFWKRAERPGLESCSRMVGKRLYVNAPLFALWMAGQLPGQGARQ